LFCNVLDIGDRNYFSCLAAGDYTVSIYTAVGGTLISSQNIAANVQCNWQIDWDACTHNIDDYTRQAYVEITPQAGQSLTLLSFNTNHPAESNATSATYIVSAYGALPELVLADNMFVNQYSLISVIFVNLESVTVTTNMFSRCYGLQNAILTNLSALSNAANMLQACWSLHNAILTNLSTVVAFNGMLGTIVDTNNLRSIRKLITTGLGSAFANATIFNLRHTAIQAEEALAWVDSLGTSTNTITFDLRNNPFSTSTLVAPAILAKFPNAVVQLV
jgi:hypothetical protein